MFNEMNKVSWVPFVSISFLSMNLWTQDGFYKDKANIEIERIFCMSLTIFYTENSVGTALL